MKKGKVLTAIAVGVFLSIALSSQAAIITFDEPGITERQIIDDEYAPGVIIRADNKQRPDNRDYSVIFDSRNNSNTNDPDLIGPMWSGGNLGPMASMGNILIIEENGIEDASRPGFIDRNPDDEGGRPAGYIEFEFMIPVIAFGFDLIDIEMGLEQALGSFASFQSSTGKTAVIPFSVFTIDDPTNPFFLDDVEFGNKTVNQIDPITALMLGLTDFDKVQIHLGGSGAIDNIVYEAVPIPGSAVLLMSGLLGLIGITRIRRTN